MLTRAQTPGNMAAILGNSAYTMAGDQDKKSSFGFMDRLKALKTLTEDKRIDIRIAPLVGAAGPHINKHLLSAFDGQRHIRARPLSNSVEYDSSESEAWDTAIAQAETYLTESRADLLIWGEAHAAGTTMTLRFLSATPAQVDRFGYLDARSELHLPVDFDQTLAELLIPFCIAAMNPTMTPATNTKGKIANGILTPSLNSMQDHLENLSKGLTSRESASVQFCAANTFAYMAQVYNYPALFQKAETYYRSALATLTETEHPFDWALVQLNLAACLQVIAERDGGQQSLQDGINACEQALSILNQQSHGDIWAMAQNRLGFLLYKMDFQTGDSELLKRSLTAFQSALKVFTRAESPRLWADAMNNFAQAALVLGEQMHNADVLNKAIHACNATLDVRTQDDNPLQWAATQNNLGSALFMLGKLNNEESTLAGAHEAFARALSVYQSHGAKRLADVTIKNQEHVKRLLEKS